MSAKSFFKSIMTVAVALPMCITAQIDVNREKYPDYTDKLNPDYTMLQKPTAQSGMARSAEARGARPAYVNNAEQKFFPPVFNQDGGSCGSASRICYMFTYELNAYRNLDGKRPENYYPSHFVWLLTNSSSGKNEFVTSIGVPSAATYGGQTYSSLFGNQDCSHNYFGWMQGYDKWFEAMHNRMLAPANMPLNVGTEEGRELVKNWLWNHNGDTSFKAGGVCGIGVGINGGDYEARIPNTSANNNAGATGKKYVKAWGTQVDHAVTIVGYDDRIEFDLDGNGIAGETGKDETGAWIIANSWGNTWGNNGFIYCPYAYGGPVSNSDGTFPGNWWQPEIYKVRKDYRPLRTIKLEMDYSRRSEIKLSAGISSDINSDTPEKIIEFEHFRYAGDGNYGKTQPAPEVPMLGKWADGKMHTEPMEFGYDLTDLTKGYDRAMPLKYFFIVETREWAAGNGYIHNAAIVNYELNTDGIETPFILPNGKQEIRNAGNKTIISTVVYGDPYYAPQNPFISNNTLQWETPLPSTNTITKYYIYHNDNKIAEVSAGTLSYSIPSTESKDGSFGVSAVYEGEIETEIASTIAPIPYESDNKSVNLQNSGIRLPGIFNSKYEEATIEYYIKPNTLQYYNQAIGPGWGTFMVHSDYYGAFTAGWDSGENDRFTSSQATLRTGNWSHIAIVIKSNKMTLYVNGVEKTSCTSSNYSGIGGFGDLVFRAENDYYNTNNDAYYDEIRIWDKARTADEIRNSYNQQFSGTVYPKGLIAYYKGDIITVDGKSMLHEYIASRHGEFLNSRYSSAGGYSLNGGTSPSVDINTISGNVYAGTPVKLSATCNNAVSKVKWTVSDAGVTNLAVTEPLVTFNTSGYKTITVVAEDRNGNSVTDNMEIYVYPEKDIDATFTPSKSNVIMGEKVSFIINNPSFGEMYEWSITGAEESKIYGQQGYAVFNTSGRQTVTLKVTSLSGNKTATSSIYVDVTGSAPVAAFEVSPAVLMKGERVYLKDQSKYNPEQWMWTIESDSSQYTVNGKEGSFVPKRSGIYNATLEVSNRIGSNSKTQERALIVCNADSKNGLNFSGRENAKVTATTKGFSGEHGAFTVEWWMRPEELMSNCLGIGENESTFLITAEADGRVSVHIGGTKVRGYSGYIIPGEWHHYAVVLENGYLSLYCDGKRFERDYVSYNAKIPSLGSFSIGKDNAVMNGQIDEFRIWTRALSNDALVGVCNTPIENPAEHSDLALYYNFNQSSGDVTDRTSNGNNGVRSGFGPDGDAWGLSRGVFCLCYGEEATKEDVTSMYLTNYRAEFAHSGNLVNSFVSNRFYELTGWTIENAGKNGNVTTGAHVDAEKDYHMTFTSDWDSFGAVSNHKTYQTVTLPAGKYRFVAKYSDKWEGQCGNSYLVAAKGAGLPDTDNVSSSIAYTKMKENDHETVSSHEIEFTLERKTEVSLGLIVNLEYKKCLTISEFILEWEYIEGSDEEGDEDEEENNTSIEDVTSLYLNNYRAEFAHSGNLINTNINNRFYELTGWTIENAGINGNITTGAHVDAQKDYYMTFTSNWDGFGAVSNHKTYQTVTLPAGKYRFIARYNGKWEGQSGNSYLVASKGAGLPDTDDVASAIAYTKMKEYDHETVFSNEIEFTLDKETQVSLGLIVNLDYKKCLTINEFVLEWEELEDSGTTAIESTEGRIEQEHIYNLHGMKVLKPQKGNIYIKNGKKFYAK